MTYEQAVAAFVATVQEKAAATVYVRNQLELHVTDGNQEGFGIYCMSVARKLLDGSMPTGSVHDGVVRLWEEMGGREPVRPFPQRGAPVIG